MNKQLNGFTNKSMKSKDGNVRRSLSWTIVAKIGSQIISVATTIFLARLLSIKDFGLMAMCVVYMDFLNNFIDAGFLQAIIQKKKINQEILSSCFWFLVPIVGLCYLITWICSPVISLYFGEPYLVKMLRAISLVLLLAPVQILGSSILIRELKSDRVGIAELIGLIGKAIVSVGLALIGFGVWSLVVGYIVMRLTIAFIIACQSKWIPSFYFNKTSLKAVLSFGIKVTGSRILWYLYSRIDNIIIGRVLGSEALGLYSVSFQLVNAVLNLFSIIYQRVVFPVFTKLQDDISALSQLFLKIIVITALISIPLMFGVSAVASDIIGILFSSKWADAAGLLSALACVAGIRVIGLAGPVAMNAVGRPEVNMYLNFINLIVMSVSLYFSAVLWGLHGVALTWLVVYPAFFIIAQKIFTSILHINFAKYLLDLSGPLMLGGFIMVIALLCNKWVIVDTIWIRFSITLCICFLSYSLIMLIKFRDRVKEAISLIKPV